MSAGASTRQQTARQLSDTASGTEQLLSQTPASHLPAQHLLRRADVALRHRALQRGPPAGHGAGVSCRGRGEEREKGRGWDSVSKLVLLAAAATSAAARPGCLPHPPGPEALLERQKLQRAVGRRHARWSGGFEVCEE